MNHENYLKGCSIAQAIKVGSDILYKHNIETYALDSRILMQFIMEYTAEQMLMNIYAMMTMLQCQKYMDLIGRRARSEPVAHLIANKEFWGHDFKITCDTLIPRPDSETIISAIMQEAPDTQKPYEILDLGIGSGCLAITILLEYPASFVVGVDLHLPALLVAKENAINHNVDDRLLLINSSWASAINKQFDIIITNPPYVEIRSNLPPEIYNFEPHLALFAGEDGMSSYKDIAQYALEILKHGGIFICECGVGQHEKIIEIFKNIGLNHSNFYYDLSGRIRCLSFTK